MEYSSCKDSIPVIDISSDEENGIIEISEDEDGWEVEIEEIQEVGPQAQEIKTWKRKYLLTFSI